MTGARLLAIQYGYGAAHMPLPFVYRVPSRQWWFLHPSLVGLVGSLVILALLRSCVTPVTMPGRTILWLQPTPVTVPPKTAEPALAVRQAVKAPVVPPVKKPERVILKVPTPIVETFPPPEILLRKKQRSTDRTVYERPKEVAHAPSTAPRLDLAKQARTPVRNNTYMEQPAPDIPVPDSAYTFNRAMNSQRSESARDRQMVAGPTFSPIMPEETAGPSLPRTSLAGGRSKPVMVFQGPAAPGVEAVADAPSLTIGRANNGSGNRPGGPSMVSRPAGFTADLPDTATGPVSSSIRSKDKETEEMVTIVGTIDGESTRIASLKEAIFRKAQSGALKPGAYCCTISGVECKVAITEEKRVRLSFSRSVVPFDVVSRLERLLPEGVRRCAD